MSQRASGPSIRALIVPALAAGAAAAMARGSSPFPNVPVLTGLAAAGYVLAFASPVWALVALFVTELTFASDIWNEIGMSVRLATSLGATLCLAGPLLRSGRLSDPRFRRIALPAVGFVALATVVNLLFSDATYALKYLRYQAAVLLVFACVAVAIRDREDLKRILWVAVALAAASGVAALWQHYDGASAPFGAANAAWLQSWKSRSLGLADNPVNLAGNMACVLTPAIGVLVMARVRGVPRLLLIGAMVLMALAMYWTFTRSGMLAVGAGLVAMALFLPPPRRNLVLGAVVGAYLVFELSRGTGLIGARYYQNANDDRSAASHQALLDVGLAVAMDHVALGIGHEHFEEISQQYADVVADTDNGVSGGIAIGQEPPHNDFLSVWVSWGIGALALYVAVFVGALRNFATAARSPDQLVRAVAVGGLGGLVAYAANSAFHNYLDSSAALWIFAGLSVALVAMPAAAPQARSAHAQRMRARRARAMRRHPQRAFRTA